MRCGTRVMHIGLMFVCACVCRFWVEVTVGGIQRCAGRVRRVAGVVSHEA